MQSTAKSQNTAQLVLCDDHPVVRDALKTLLSTSTEFKVVGEAGTVQEAMRLVSSLHPSLMVLDMTLPDCSGIEALYQIRSQHLNVRTVVFSMHDDERLIRQAIGAGASGYLDKSAPGSKVLEVLRKVNNGELALPEGMSALNSSSAEHGEPLSSIISAPDPLARLSKREREIFYLLIEGLPNRTIAQKLFVSPRTIETHRARVIRKLGCCSTADLIRYAIRHHLSSP